MKFYNLFFLLSIINANAISESEINMKNGLTKLKTIVKNHGLQKLTGMPISCENNTTYVMVHPNFSECVAYSYENKINELISSLLNSNPIFSDTFPDTFLKSHNTCNLNRQSDTQTLLTPSSTSQMVLSNIISLTLDMKLNITGLILEMFNFSIENIINIQDETIYSTMLEMADKINQTSENNPLTIKYLFKVYTKKLLETALTETKTYEENFISALVFFETISRDIRADNASILIKALSVLILESQELGELNEILEEDHEQNKFKAKSIIENRQNKAKQNYDDDYYDDDY